MGAEDEGRGWDCDSLGEPDSGPEGRPESGLWVEDMAGEERATMIDVDGTRSGEGDDNSEGNDREAVATSGVGR